MNTTNDSKGGGRWRACVVVACAMISFAQMPPFSEQVRGALDRAIGAKGVYVSEESAYKFTFPRNDVSVRVGSQRLTAAQAPHSWVTFQPSMKQQAIMSGELIVLDDEVNPVLSVALNAGLDVTGLGPTLLLEQPRLLALNVIGEGAFQTLGSAWRKTLDEIQRVRAKGIDRSASGPPRGPVTNAIDADAINAILSMRGVSVDGIYRAAIGRVMLVNGTPIGREMGMSSKISIFGTGDRAFIDADLIVNSDELRRVLMALRSRNLNVTAIRNHIVAEHPQAVFIRSWGQASAVDLAKALRYALDVQVGAVRPPPGL